MGSGSIPNDWLVGWLVDSQKMCEHFSHNGANPEAYTDMCRRVDETPSSVAFAGKKPPSKRAARMPFIQGLTNPSSSRSSPLFSFRACLFPLSLREHPFYSSRYYFSLSLSRGAYARGRRDTDPSRSKLRTTSFPSSHRFVPS